MAKSKGSFGRFIAFATIAGAVAAGISYFTKYRSFHKELEEDFHDFEDDDEDSPVDSTMSRNYVPINTDKKTAEPEKVVEIEPEPVSDIEPGEAPDVDELYSMEEPDLLPESEEDIKKIDFQTGDSPETISVEESQ